MAHAILKIPRNASDNPPNTRKLMISRKRSQSLVQRSNERTRASMAHAILKIPRNPANPASDNPPNTRKHTQTLMISRKRSQSLVQRSYERTCVSRSSPILKIPRNPANPAPDNPPNTRKHTQTLVISRKRSQSLVQHSYERTCPSRTPVIPKFPRNPANPASDNPPNTRKHSKTLVISRTTLMNAFHMPVRFSYPHHGIHVSISSKLTSMLFSFRMTQATWQRSPKFRLKKRD